MRLSQILSLHNTATLAPIRTYALANELIVSAASSDGQSVIEIPYGTWPYGAKEITLPDGTRRTIYVTQKLDRNGAIEIANTINTAIAQQAPGLPIYWGHPDVPEVADKFPDKRAKGWINGAEATAHALRLSNVAWLEAPQGAFRWFSPFWHGLPEWVDDNNVITHINAISSIGLTNNPNILEFRLANEANYTHTTPPTSGKAAHQKGKQMDRELLLKLLGLPPEATDEEIAAAITKYKSAADEAQTKIEAANAETEAEKKAKDEATTALANERTTHINILLDQAIVDGRITIAGRAAWAKRLADDFATGSVALANEKRTVKTVGQVGTDPRTTQRTESLLDLANTKMAAQKIPFADAWAAVKRERPDLCK